jgi:hypothetical protein
LITPAGPPGKLGRIAHWPPTDEASRGPVKSYAALMPKFRRAEGQYSRYVQQPIRPAPTSCDRSRPVSCTNDRHRPACHSFTPRRSQFSRDIPLRQGPLRLQLRESGCELWRRSSAAGRVLSSGSGRGPVPGYGSAPWNWPHSWCANTLAGRVDSIGAVNSCRPGSSVVSE